MSSRKPAQGSLNQPGSSSKCQNLESKGLPERSSVGRGLDDTQPVSQVFPELSPTRRYELDTQPVSQVFPDITLAGSYELNDTQPVSQVFPEKTCLESPPQVELDDTQPVSQVFPETQPDSFGSTFREQNDKQPGSQDAPKTQSGARNVLSEPADLLMSQTLNKSAVKDNPADSDTDFSDDAEQPSKQKSRDCDRTAATSECDNETVSKKETLELMSVETSGSASPSKIAKDVTSNSSSDTSVIVNITGDSEKRSGNDDDSEVIASSQDLFSSQPGFHDSQNVYSSSQLVPTFRLSGEVTGYSPNFMPDRLTPSTPSNPERGTSTPMKCESQSLNSKNSEVISISDDEVNITANEKTESLHRDKRKLSDCSEDSERAVALPKKFCVNQTDSRQSIMVVAELCKKPTSAAGSESVSQSESQAFHLHFSSSPSDRDTLESHCKSGSDSNMWKSPLESIPSSSSNELKESSLCDTGSKDRDNSNSNLNVSVLPVSDAEDDVQFISPKDMRKPEEITLDNSGHCHGISTSNDGIEVLSPANMLKPSRPSASFRRGRRNFGAPISNGDPSASLRVFKLNPKLKVADSSNNSEQTKTNAIFIKEFENEFSFTISYKVKCKVSVNTQEKRIINTLVHTSQKLHSGEPKTGDDDAEKESSPNGFADESSSIPSQGSPGSVMSGPGPFTLPLKRQSIASTVSSSSASSSASGMYHRGNHHPFARVPLPVDVDCNIIHNASKHPLFKELLHSDVTQDSISGSSLLDQWAAAGTLGMSDWMDGLLKTDNHGVSTAPDKNLSSLPSLRVLPENEDDTGVVTLDDKKLPPARGRRRKPVSSKSTSSSRSLNKKQTQVEGVKDTESVSLSKKTSTKVSDTLTPDPNRTIGPQILKSITQKNPDPAPVQEQKSFTSLNFFVPGAPVFALYRNFYYPAVLESQTRPDYWSVAFHDGYKTAVSVKFILLIPTLENGQHVSARIPSSEKGQRVSTRSQQTAYEEGVVTSVTPCVGNDDLYTIQLLEGGEVTVPRSDLCLSLEQAKAFSVEAHHEVLSSASSPPPKRTPRDAIDLRLIMEGKRRTPQQSGRNSPAPGRSNISRQLNSDDSSSATDDGPLASIIVTGVQPEQEGIKCADPLIGKGRGTKGKRTANDIDDEALIKEYGPLPPEGSKIFAGKYFLLTYTEAQPLHRNRRNLNLDSSIQSSDFETDADGKATKMKIDSDANGAPIKHGTDSECFDFAHYPLSKQRLRRQIEQGGGKIINELWEILPKHFKNTFVVTNRPCFTPTYIRCLARGIHGLTHDYIIDCCKENKKLTNIQSNRLPAGHSILRKTFVTWQEHKSQSPLQGQNILVDGDKNFKEFWEDILKMAGATLVTENEIKEVTTIVSDNPCSHHILRQAQELGKPVVSPEWVKQTLIHNEPLPTDAHRTFAFDFSDID